METKKFIRLLSFGSVFLLCFGFIGVEFALAQNQTSYQLLAPLPNFGETYTTGGFSEYVKNIINLSITVAAILAVLMIVIGGFKYMGSESMGAKSEGKDQIRNAILGLVLLSASYLILYTINPALLNFNLNIGKVGNNAAPKSNAPATATYEEPSKTEQGIANTRDTEIIGKTVSISTNLNLPRAEQEKQAAEQKKLLADFSEACVKQGGRADPDTGGIRWTCYKK